MVIVRLLCHELLAAVRASVGLASQLSTPLGGAPAAHNKLIDELAGAETIEKVSGLKGKIKVAFIELRVVFVLCMDERGQRNSKSCDERKTHGGLRLGDLASWIG
ncbi:hypothetical protein DFP72DRAFT_885575 [Ephemerocybe angulata]|uniref:Uncharacterized protein n=1 Tax=Ephemerocybe angulata TaxID=980116 RepID=A0A8H6M980_9AGAR|nr:hypothetical protein DFP72DRAFT_885575 [Tulosesus angulatus]